jgi:hypothetical protein
MPVATEWFDHRSNETRQLAADATPKALIVFGPVPQGFLWYVEVLTARFGGTHTAVLNLFSGHSDQGDLVNFADRVDNATAATDQSRDYVNPRIVKPGEFLVAAFNAGTLVQGDQVTCTVQIAWCLANPTSAYGDLNWREMLSLSEQERVGEAERRGAVVVGGSGWGVNVYEPDDVAANAFTPWTDVAPGDTADDPAMMPNPLPGGYVGGNREGAQHPRPPYDGRILPDGSVDRTS